MSVFTTCIPRFNSNCCNSPAIPFFSCAFGTVTYLYFGADTCSIIILNLNGGPLSTAAKLGIVIELGLSVPISLSAMREAIEISFFHHATQCLWVKKTILSVAFVVGAFIFTFLPKFSMIINIVGACSISIFSFVLPPLMLLQLRRFHWMAHSMQASASTLISHNLQVNVSGCSRRFTQDAISFDPLSGRLQRNNGSILNYSK